MEAVPSPFGYAKGKLRERDLNELTLKFHSDIRHTIYKIRDIDADTYGISCTDS